MLLPKKKCDSNTWKKLKSALDRAKGEEMSYKNIIVSKRTKKKFLTLKPKMLYYLNFRKVLREQKGALKHKTVSYA